MADESENACLVNPKSPANGNMPYTDGLNKATVVSSVQYNAHTAQTRATTSSSSSAHETHPMAIHHTTHSNTTNNSYDINDDIILSQFHADAIKQVCRCRTKQPPFHTYAHYGNIRYRISVIRNAYTEFNR